MERMALVGLHIGGRGEGRSWWGGRRGVGVG